ncbi:hypothetical protein JKF63_00299 [Porcisia hertigi]|uniref:Uncharacterized protein n=1 Tax=Porcisia hertigi TaxID=2761500 RepID=A0A836I808_9TRYP|nr:hypothetical protein JKF63_00299 [Porcisia hertigi]
MLSLSFTSVFRAYCAGAAFFEIVTIVKLLNGDMTLPQAGAWVDRDYNSSNKPLMYVFVAILACLVISRSMACALPRTRMIIAYLVVVHTFEAGLYIYCCLHKKDAPSHTVYITLTLMGMNMCLFSARFAHLKAQHTKVENADIEWRREQLAIIRKRRADYSKQKSEKKMS